MISSTSCWVVAWIHRTASRPLRKLRPHPVQIGFEMARIATQTPGPLRRRLTTRLCEREAVCACAARRGAALAAVVSACIEHSRHESHEFTRITTIRVQQNGLSLSRFLTISAISVSGQKPFPIASVGQTSMARLVAAIHRQVSRIPAVTLLSASSLPPCRLSTTVSAREEGAMRMPSAGAGLSWLLPNSAQSRNPPAA